MASVLPITLIKPSKPQVLLVPWDPTSPEHVQRLFHQRIACGWDHEAVEEWRVIQESGKFNLQWIVLHDSDPGEKAKLIKHAEAHPEEQEPLLDSATSFGAKPRVIPLPQRNFIPVGHICLGRMPAEWDTSEVASNQEGFYWISNFYVSRALQGSGLGSASMDAIENLAISEPLCAKKLGLSAISKDDPEREEKYKALGMTIPPASIPD